MTPPWMTELLLLLTYQCTRSSGLAGFSRRTYATGAWVAAITPGAKATGVTPSQVPAFIERDVDIGSPRKPTMRVVQAFGAAAGAARDAKDAGDRTGGQVWPGGVALARYLARSPQMVRGKAVIELGAGTGIGGLSAAWAGARLVALTDGSPAVLDSVTRRNAAVNAPPRSRVTVGRLRWGYEGDLQQWLSKPWDIVLAAEVGYERYTLDALLLTISRLLATREDSMAILQCTPELVDNGRGLAYVQEAIAKKGLVIASFTQSADDEDEDEGTARLILRRESTSSV